SDARPRSPSPKPNDFIVRQAIAKSRRSTTSFTPTTGPRKSSADQAEAVARLTTPIARSSGSNGSWDCGRRGIAEMPDQIGQRLRGQCRCGELELADFR